MAHSLEMQAPPLGVGKVDVVFGVKRNGRKFGKLKVSQGRVEWMPAWKSQYARELAWSELAGLFREHGRKVRTRTGKRW